MSAESLSAESLSAESLAVDPLTAARRLLGATLIAGGVEARIVEVEAYGGGPDGPWPDAASHSFGGPGGRNRIMFGPAGRLYTYLSHGIHVCANVVCGPPDVAAAVLLRAAVVEKRGVALASERRGASGRQGAGVDAPALARGPGNLCSALGITMADNGVEVFDRCSPVKLRLPAGPVRAVASGPRVGVSRAADRTWRLWLPDHPEVSRYRRSPRAPAPGSSD